VICVPQKYPAPLTITVNRGSQWSIKNADRLAFICKSAGRSLGPLFIAKVRVAGSNPVVRSKEKTSSEGPTDKSRTDSRRANSATSSVVPPSHLDRDRFFCWTMDCRSHIDNHLSLGRLVLDFSNVRSSDSASAARALGKRCPPRKVRSANDDRIPAAFLPSVRTGEMPVTKWHL
jgi:hypothetical protein